MPLPCAKRVFARCYLAFAVVVSHLHASKCSNNETYYGGGFNGGALFSGAPNFYVGTQEESYFGEQWQNLTNHVLQLVDQEDIRVISFEPLIILWDNFVDEDWIQEVLEYNKKVLDHNQGQSCAMWCVALNSPEAHKLRATLLLRGVAEQPIVSGTDLCVRGAGVDMLKELYNVKNPPDQYVVRAVVDKAADKIESAVESRLGFPLDYAEYGSIISYRTNGSHEARTDCLGMRMNDRIFTLLVFLDTVEGGETMFPHPDVNSAVSPRRGTALLYRNFGPPDHCDLRTMHREMPLRNIQDGKPERKQVYRLWFNMRPVLNARSSRRVLCNGVGSCDEYMYAPEVHQNEIDYEMPLDHTSYQIRTFRMHRTPNASKLPIPYKTSDPFADHLGHAVAITNRAVTAKSAKTYRAALQSFESAVRFSRGSKDMGNLGFFYLQKAKQLPRGNKKARKVTKKAMEWLVKARNRLTDGKYDMTNPVPDGQYKQFIDQQIQLAQELLT